MLIAGWFLLTLKISTLLVHDIAAVDVDPITRDNSLIIAIS